MWTACLSVCDIALPIETLAGNFRADFQWIVKDSLKFKKEGTHTGVVTVSILQTTVLFWRIRVLCDTTLYCLNIRKLLFSGF
jgi:hypothetical protein